MKTNGNDGICLHSYKEPNENAFAPILNDPRRTLVVGLDLTHSNIGFLQ